MRLIDADALKAVMIETLECIKENPKMDGQERHIIAAIATLGQMIDDAPTVDAVPVVRCKYCQHCSEYGDIEPKSLWCEEGKNDVNPFDFCCWGERREQDG